MTIPRSARGWPCELPPQPDMEVCGQAADAAEAVKLLEAVRPDVVVVDIQLETGNGLDLVERIKARDESIGILVWSMYPDAIYAQRALQAGALGYINKRHATSQIVEAIRRVRERQDLPLRRDHGTVVWPDGRQGKASQSIGSGVPFGPRIGGLSAHRPGSYGLPNLPASSPQRRIPWNRTARRSKPSWP